MRLRYERSLATVLGVHIQFSAEGPRNPFASGKRFRYIVG